MVGREREKRERNVVVLSNAIPGLGWGGGGVETCCHDILMGARWALEWGEGNEVNMSEMWDFFFVGMGWWR